MYETRGLEHAGRAQAFSIFLDLSFPLFSLHSIPFLYSAVIRLFSALQRICISLYSPASDLQHGLLLLTGTTIHIQR